MGLAATVRAAIDWAAKVPVVKIRAGLSRAEMVPAAKVPAGMVEAAKAKS